MFNFKSRENIFLWDYYDNSKQIYDILMNYILKRGISEFKDYDDK